MSKLSQIWFEVQGVLFPFIEKQVEEPLTEKLKHLVTTLELIRIEDMIRVGMFLRVTLVVISCVLTSASLHDSQVALPLAELTSQRVTNLYDLMDSAYDSPIIKQHSRSLDHVPIIDVNPRGNKKRKLELKEETLRFGVINFKNPADIRYNERSNVERVNGRLKDEFGGKMVRVRGYAKVMTHLMFGIIALTSDQLMRFVT